MSPFFLGRKCCCTQNNCADGSELILEEFEYLTGGTASIDTFIHESKGDIFSDSTIQTIGPDWAAATAGEKSGAPFLRLLAFIYAEMDPGENFPTSTIREISIAWFPTPFILENKKLVVTLQNVRKSSGANLYLYARQGGKIYEVGGFTGVNTWAGSQDSTPDIADCAFGESSYTFSPLQNVASIDPVTGYPSTSTKRVNIYEDLEIGVGVYSELMVNSSTPEIAPNDFSAANISGICWEWGDTVSIPCDNYVCCFDDSEITTEVIGVTWPSGSYGYPAGSAGSAAKDFGLAFFQGWIESVINRETSFGGSPQCDCGWSIFSESVYSGAEKFQFRMTAYRNRETSGYRGVWVEITFNWITSSVNSFIKSTYRASTDDQDECSGSVNLPWYQSTQTSGATYMGWFDFRNTGETINVSW